MEISNTAKVSDQALIATLIYLGFPVRGTDKPEFDRRVSFFFEQDSDLKATMESFWNGSLLVDPKRFSQSLKEVKTRISQIYPEFSEGR